MYHKQDIPDDLQRFFVSAEIGKEATPAEFVATMVEVFREVRRVLRNDATLWLNLGDSYASNWPCSRRNVVGNGSLASGKRADRAPRMSDGLKEKDMIGIPWRVAFALQADGWYLRSDICWSKANPMPESVTDRPTSSHEHIFLLTKNARYFYDAEAIRMPLKESSQVRLAQDIKGQAGSTRANGGTKSNGNMKAVGGKQRGHVRRHDGFSDRWDAMPKEEQQASGANARDVWTMATMPYKGSHYATFPPELPRRCIAAGTSARGCCEACGAPWTRILEQGEARKVRWAPGPDKHTIAVGGKGATSAMHTGIIHDKITTGWQPSCKCDAAVIPCTVLDPFVGSGTTLAVAMEMGRASIGIDLDPMNETLMRRRIEAVTLPMVELLA